METCSHSRNSSFANVGFVAHDAIGARNVAMLIHWQWPTPSANVGSRAVALADAALAPAFATQAPAAAEQAPASGALALDATAPAPPAAAPAPSSATHETFSPAQEPAP